MLIPPNLVIIFGSALRQPLVLDNNTNKKIAVFIPSLTSVVNQIEPVRFLEEYLPRNLLLLHSQYKPNLIKFEQLRRRRCYCALEKYVLCIEAFFERTKLTVKIYFILNERL